MWMLNADVMRCTGNYVRELLAVCYANRKSHAIYTAVMYPMTMDFSNYVTMNLIAATKINS